MSLSRSKDMKPRTSGKPVYQPPPLLPSPYGDEEPSAHPRNFPSSEQPRRKLSALIAPPSVPSLLSDDTSALVVGSDAAFVAETTALLERMGVRAVGLGSVGEALNVLEDDIGANGCITFDQILCEMDRDGEEGGETLISELRSTSWPASVVLVTSAWPSANELAAFAKTGARAVLRKPVNQAELARLFTHLKRKPHEELWQAGRTKAGAATVLSELPKTMRRETPLHITAMGVGMVTFLHVHAGRSKGPNPVQTFKVSARRGRRCPGGGSFRCLGLPAAHPPLPCAPPRPVAFPPIAVRERLRLRHDAGRRGRQSRVDLPLCGHRDDQPAAGRGAPRHGGDPPRARLPRVATHPHRNKLAVCASRGDHHRCEDALRRGGVAGRLCQPVAHVPARLDLPARGGDGLPAGHPLLRHRAALELLQVL
mmetsp:Transcript_266/g.750  ORF Transcript_266/g.750 Transcript_266/m.750 type:complete len:425 (+) Transcript_266:114-1388(+)